jgi:hypothetical protein
MYQGQMSPQMNYQNPKPQQPNTQIFTNIPGIMVKQKIEMMEAWFGCETENTYKVYTGDVNGKKQSKLFINKKQTIPTYSRSKRTPTAALACACQASAGLTISR